MNPQTVRVLDVAMTRLVATQIAYIEDLHDRIEALEAQAAHEPGGSR